MGQVLAKKQLTPADYHLWSSMYLKSISDNGKWVSYNQAHDTGADTLVIKEIHGDRTYKFPQLYSGVFMNSTFAFIADGRLVLKDLPSGAEAAVEGAVSFLCMPVANQVAALVKTEDGNNLQLFSPTGKLEASFRKASDYSMSMDGKTLAISTESASGNKLILRKIKEGKNTEAAVDTDFTFHKLTWQKEGNAVAFFQSAPGSPTVRKVGLYKRGNNRLFTLAVSDPDFPRGMVPDAAATPLQVSGDGRRVFFGIIEEHVTMPAPEKVELWNGNDKWIYPALHRVNGWENNPKIALWRPYEGTLLQITDSIYPKGMVTADARYAFKFNPLQYEPQFKFFGDIDLHITDLETGASRLLLEKQCGILFHTIMSPSGKQVAYFKGVDWWLYDIATDRHLNITKKFGIDAVDSEHDMAGEPMPSGLGGWTKGDASLLLYDRHDIWEIAADGSSSKRLTRGKEKNISFRIANPRSYAFTPSYSGYIADEVDLEGCLLQAKGTLTYDQGYFLYTRKAGERPLYFESSKSHSVRFTKKGTGYVFVTERFDLPPQLMSVTPNGTATTIAASNPHHKDYQWGKARLVRFKNSEGRNLSGILYYPAGYTKEKKYPVVVNIYSLQSRYLHEYVNPSLYGMTDFNISNYVADGYLVFLPDIVYKIGDPGLSAVDCVTAGVKEVIATESVDRGRIGLIGHSFGGYEAAFISTQTDLFATIVVGAAATHLASWYLTVGWNTEQPDMWRFEDQQFRMGKSFFDDIGGYHRNCPVMNAPKINTPLLLWTGGQDMQVHTNQTLEFHLALRRLGKPHIMLRYPKDDHILFDRDNQADFSTRLRQWFGYYLKREPPAEWIRKGVSPRS